MTLPKKTIAVYTEGAVSTGSLFHRLRQTFNAHSCDIRGITSHDIENGALGGVSALFLPGVEDDSRSYRAGLTPSVAAKIRAFIENGGISIGLCAGGYLSATRFQYVNKRTGVTKIIHSPLALFDGEAFGPIAAYTKGSDDTHQWGNHAIARLAFNDAAEGRACYALGPWLELSPAAQQDPAYEVIARYVDIPGAPVAIASRRIGRGKAVFCGVLPEISGADMPVTSERFTVRDPGLRAGYAFARELAAHEPARRFTWETLIRLIP